MFKSLLTYYNTRHPHSNVMRDALSSVLLQVSIAYQVIHNFFSHLYFRSSWALDPHSYWKASPQPPANAKDISKFPIS